MFLLYTGSHFTKLKPKYNGILASDEVIWSQNQHSSNWAEKPQFPTMHMVDSIASMALLSSVSPDLYSIKWSKYTVTKELLEMKQFEMTRSHLASVKPSLVSLCLSDGTK